VPRCCPPVARTASSSSEAARYLTVHHGPAFEQFATAPAGEGDDMHDLARLTEIAAAHGIDIVGFPRRSLSR
jgi:hypothetical protein